MFGEHLYFNDMTVCGLTGMIGFYSFVIIYIKTYLIFWGNINHNDVVCV